jgi:hypothetical protein
MSTHTQLPCCRQWVVRMVLILPPSGGRAAGQNESTHLLGSTSHHLKLEAWRGKLSLSVTKHSLDTVVPLSSHRALALSLKQV